MLLISRNTCKLTTGVTGDKEHSFTGKVTEYNESSAAEEDVTFDCTLTIDGAVTTSTIS